MALDSALKRGSSINVLLPWRSLPFPDGTIGQADRQHVAYAYSGILAEAPPVDPPIPQDPLRYGRVDQSGSSFQRPSDSSGGYHRQFGTPSGYARP